MSCNHYPYHNSGPTHTKQSVRTEQKLIQDQNYSNEIFYGLLSTIESLVQYYEQKSHDYKNKMFKHYDRVDYSSKNLNELKSQLQSQIFIFQTSRKIFEQENPKNQWTLPRNFDRPRSEQFLGQALNVFQQVQDQQSQRLTKDVFSILRGSFDNLYSEGVDLKVQYSEEERKKHKKELFNHGVLAGEEMDKRKAEAANYEQADQLQAHINESSGTFNSFNGQNGSAPNDFHKGSSPSHNTNDQPLPAQKEEERMDVEDQPSQYRVFKIQDYANQFAKNGSNFGQYYYHSFKHLQQIQSQKNDLLWNGYRWCVPVYWEGNKIRRGVPVGDLSKL